jgi:hypothetical protein
MFLGGRSRFLRGAQKELLDSVKGLSPAKSRETAEAMITGGSNHFENAWRSPR